MDQRAFLEPIEDTPIRATLEPIEEPKVPLWTKVTEFLTGHTPYGPEPPPEVTKEGKINVPESAEVPFFQDPTTAVAFGGAAALRKPVATLAQRALTGAREAIGWATGGASEIPALAKGATKGIAKAIETKAVAPRMAALREVGLDVPVKAILEEVKPTSAVASSLVKGEVTPKQPWEMTKEVKEGWKIANDTSLLFSERVKKLKNLTLNDKELGNLITKMPGDIVGNVGNIKTVGEKQTVISKVLMNVKNLTENGVSFEENIQSAINEYRKSVEIDRYEYGMRSGLPEEAGDRLISILEKEYGLEGKGGLGERGSTSLGAVTLGAEQFVKEDIAPLAKDVAKGFVQLKGQIKSVLAPSTVGPASKETALILRQNLGQMARNRDMAEYALRDASKMFDKLPAETNFDFINKMEIGQKQTNTVFEPVSKTLRESLDTKRDEIQALGTGKLEQFYEDYFPHIWKDPEGIKDVVRSIFSKKPLEGSKAFLKHRRIPTIADGMQWRVYGEDGTMIQSFATEVEAKGFSQAGGGLSIKSPLEPVSSNPIDLVRLKMAEMDRYLMAQNTFKEMKDKGLAKAIIYGKAQAPEGWVKIDDKIARIMVPEETEKGVQFIERGNYYAPKEAARILNNYLAPGLREKSLAYRGYLATGNLMNQAQLGLSAFHLGFTSIDASVSKAALGIHQLAYGQPIKAAKSFLETPIAPITNIIRGDKVIKEWLSNSGKNPELAEMIDAVVSAGGRVKMDRFYRTEFSKNMVQKLKEGNILGAAVRLPQSIIEQVAKPIMDYIVPRQKLGVFADLARFEMERLGPQATKEQTREVMAKVWDSVDNRMGQFVYDNLFWNKTLKDIGLGSVRSLGWNLGTMKEVGGGLYDLGKAMGNIARLKKPEITYRIEYMTALPIVTGMIGGMTHYLATEESPQTLRDCYFPKTGLKDDQGRDERLSLPSYVKDIYHYTHGLGRTIMNKVHPMLNAIGELYTNKDFYGVQIRQEDDKLYLQGLDWLKHLGKTFIPFGIRGIIRETELGEKTGKKYLPMVGLTPAPADIKKTPTEIVMSKILAKSYPEAPIEKVKYEQRELKKKSKAIFRNTGEILPELLDSVRNNKVGIKKAAEWLKETESMPLESGFKRLELKDSLKVWEIATKEEKRILFPLLMKKYENRLKQIERGEATELPMPKQ